MNFLGGQLGLGGRSESLAEFHCQLCPFITLRCSTVMCQTKLHPVRILHQATFESLYLDVVGVGEEHGQTVNAHAPACRWRQPILQCCAEGLIDEHGFIVALSFGLNRVTSKSVTYTPQRMVSNFRQPEKGMFVSFPP